MAVSKLAFFLSLESVLSLSSFSCTVLPSNVKQIQCHPHEREADGPQVNTVSDLISRRIVLEISECGYESSAVANRDLETNAGRLLFWYEVMRLLDYLRVYVYNLSYILRLRPVPLFALRSYGRECYM